MGKNHRHKKNLKAEKGKVKLKVKNEKTKFLPKGKNVTDLSFKVKQIILPEQLQQKEQSEFRSRRNLNCSELLTRLRHHNVPTRLEACEEIGQLFIHHHEDMLQQLSVILKGVSSLILDVDKKIRVAAIKAIDRILEVSSGKMEPFFNIIYSYLKCALTHLDLSIKEDGLLVFDSLMRNLPSLMAIHASVLVNHLISLISQTRGSSEAGRTLTVIMGKKLTSGKWRAKVLERICKVFDAVHRQERDNVIQSTEGVTTNINDSTYYLPLYKEEHPEYNIFDLENNANIETTNFSSYGPVLLDLLHETWLEETVDEVKADMTLLTQETGSILNMILKLSLSLWEFIRVSDDYLENAVLFKSKFKDSVGLKFRKTIMRQFPYGLTSTHTSQGKESKQGRESKKGRGSNQQSDPECLKENLMIARLFCVLNQDVKIYRKDEVKKVLEYLCGVLKRRRVFNENLRDLVDLLTALLLENSVGWTHKDVGFRELLEALLPFYDALPASASKVRLFLTLPKISRQSHLNTLIDYDKLLRTFPQLISSDNFTRDDCKKFLVLIKQMDSQNFNEAFKKQISSLIDIIFKSRNDKIFMDSKCKALMDLVVYIPKLSEAHFKQIRKYTWSNPNTESSRYMEICLDTRDTIFLNM